MDSAQNTKGASLEAAPLVPFGNFSLYIYFINLGRVKWTFCELYIRFAGKGMGGIGCFWGIDKNWGFRRFWGIGEGFGKPGAISSLNNVRARRPHDSRGTAALLLQRYFADRLRGYF
jgi:hypothetical protein